MRASFSAPFTLLPLLACASAARSPAVAAIQGSQCYAAPHSIVFPLGEDSRARTDEAEKIDSTGAWLVLSPLALKRGDDSVGRAFSYDVYGNQQGGSWWRSRDSVHISINDVFTVSSLQLSAVNNDLKGSGVASTDVVVLNAATGVYEPTQEHWSAHLLGVSCRSLPPIPKR